MTRTKACMDMNISPKMHLKWKNVIQDQMAAKKGNIKARSIHTGRDSCLLQHKEALLQFIFEHREQGMAVSVNMVAARASQVS